MFFFNFNQLFDHQFVPQSFFSGTLLGLLLLDSILGLLKQGYLLLLVFYLAPQGRVFVPIQFALHFIYLCPSYTSLGHKGLVVSVLLKQPELISENFIAL